MRNVKPDAKGGSRRAFDLARYIDEAAEAGRPISLRIDDREPLVIQDERSYQRLWELVEDLETEAAVAEALAEVERGEGRPFDEAMTELREQLGLPRRR
jgi:hypothetical protein